MTGRLITTTSGRDLTTLGTGGQTTLDCWNTLALLLERELSTAHAALLAEPLSNAARGTVDWYSQQEATPSRLMEAPPAVQQAVKSRLQTLTEDIGQLVRNLAASKSGSDHFLGSMLALALEVPGEEFVYQIEGQPVLVAWGHRTAGAQPEGMVLTGQKQKRPQSEDDRPAGKETPPAQPLDPPVAALPRRDPPPPQQPRAKPHPAVAPVAPEILPPPPKVLLRQGSAEAMAPGATFAPTRGWVAGFGPYRTGAVLLAVLVFLLLLCAFAWSRALPAPCSLARGNLAMTAILQDSQVRGAALQVEKARLVQDLAQRHAQCAPVPPQSKAGAP